MNQKTEKMLIHLQGFQVLQRLTTHLRQLYFFIIVFESTKDLVQIEEHCFC